MKELATNLIYTMAFEGHEFISVLVTTVKFDSINKAFTYLHISYLLAHEIFVMNHSRGHNNILHVT